eukprot:2863316-Amphidinium_carterae.1
MMRNQSARHSLQIDRLYAYIGTETATYAHQACDRTSHKTAIEHNMNTLITEINAHRNTMNRLKET